MKAIEWDASQDKAVGRRLADARAAKGWSLEHVAKRIGVTRATIGHWETGARAIKHRDLAAICTVLGVSADEVLFGVRRWPFEKIDFGSVADLEPIELARLEGALLGLASQLGIEIKRAAA